VALCILLVSVTVSVAIGLWLCVSVLYELLHLIEVLSSGLGSAGGGAGAGGGVGGLGVGRSGGLPSGIHGGGGGGGGGGSSSSSWNVTRTGGEGPARRGQEGVCVEGDRKGRVVDGVGETCGGGAVEKGGGLWEVGGWGDRELRENILEFLLGQVEIVGLNATETRLEMTRMYDYLEREMANPTSSSVVALRPFQVATH